MTRNHEAGRSRLTRGAPIFGILGVILLLPMTGRGADRPTLDQTLSNTSKSVERFWDQFSSITCTESVTQEKLGKEGKVEYRQDSVFDYLILMSLKEDDITVEESRLLQKSEGKAKNLPLLTTRGFPTLLLVFHPYYLENYRFELDGEEQVGGRTLIRIKFEHIPGRRSTSALALRGRDYPLDLKGTAWVEPDTGVVRRITAALAAPLDDLNLKVLTSDVVYEPEKFPNVPNQVYWLPATATIEVETARQHWRNIHKFSGYKQFSVQSDSKVGK